MMSGPLEGVRVLEFGHHLQGPYATAIMRDMGAEVIKVEPPGQGELFRKMGLFADGFSGYFEPLNRGKKSITLNLRHPQARGIVMRLAKDMDVVLENLKPGVMERLDFTYEAFSAINPRVIFASANAFGHRGPWARGRGNDPIGQSMGGIMMAQGEESGGPPRRMLGGSADTVGAVFLAVGVLAALVERDRSGVGQKVESSIYGSMVAFQPMQISAAWYDKSSLVSLRGPIVSHDGPCQDGRWITFNIVNADAWPDLCRALGREDIREHEKFATPPVRWQNREQLSAVFEETLKTQPAAYWLERLVAEDIICAPVQDYDMIRNDEQARANGYVAEVEHPLYGAITTPGVPVSFSKTPAAVQGVAPSLGEHTEEILRSIGCGEGEIASLRSERVI